MALKSAYEDLRQKTLAKVTGLWGKLAYIAHRRSSDGKYQHWGFERTHGAAAAQDSFARAHSSLVGVILRTRLRSLRDDLERSSQAEGVSSASYAAKLTASLSRLLPADCPKMAKLHLLSVLQTLSLLEARKPPDSPAASPPQSPDRSLPPPGDA